MKVIILIALVALVNGMPEALVRLKREDDDTRIVMGTVAEANKPYLCSIRRNGVHDCGGAILNANTIITAAHCLKGNQPPSVFTIGVGAKTLNDQTVYAVSQYKQHEWFEFKIMGNFDIALIRLASSINLTPGVTEALSLPTFCPDLPYGELANIAGWGRRFENTPGPYNDLSEIDLEIIRATDPGCKAYLDEGKLTHTMFCAGSAESTGSTCSGDSGGPLVYSNAEGNPELVGLVSWATGCNKAGYASIFTNVCAQHVKEWIEKWKDATWNQNVVPEQQVVQNPVNRPAFTSFNVPARPAIQYNPFAEFNQGPFFGNAQPFGFRNVY